MFWLYWLLWPTFFLGVSWRVEGFEKSDNRCHHIARIKSQNATHMWLRSIHDLKRLDYKQVSSTAAHGFCGCGQDKMMPCAAMALGMIWDPEKWPSGKQIWGHVASEKPFRRHGWSKDTFAAHDCPSKLTLYSEIVSLTESFIQGEAMLSTAAFWMKYYKSATVPQNKLSYVISLTKILNSSNENEDIFSSKNSAKIEFPAPPSTIWKCFWILLFLTCTATLSADNYDHDNRRSFINKIASKQLWESD